MDFISPIPETEGRIKRTQKIHSHIIKISCRNMQAELTPVHVSDFASKYPELEDAILSDSLLCI